MSMASISATFHLLFLALSTSSSTTFSATVVEDLANLKPPPDFNSTITTNCLTNPSLRYCSSSSSSSPLNLDEIFKFTVVASHLCNESNNPNCAESFPKIDLRNRPKIAPLYLSYDFFWKYCPLSITSIDFSNNSIEGSFPTEILWCSQVQSLDLSLNELTGDFPLERFSPLTNLTFLNLSYNHFLECRISDSRFFKQFNASSFLHSGLLPSHRNYRIKAIFMLIGFPMLVILMVGCFGWLCFRRPDYLPKFLQGKHRFTPSMLKAATDGFSRKNLVVKSEGVGIYRGILIDGTKVRIELYVDNISRETQKKFVEECEVLVQLDHKNLVKVLGWCNNRRMRAIVTEWRGGESVEMWLSGPAPPPWNQRLKIIVGVLEGMCYLQEHWPQVGYDLRTGSLLLSENLRPLISRFKVSDQNIHSRRIYKFGVLLLEMIANRRPMEEFEKREAGFVEFVRMNYPENLGDLIDGRMKLSEKMLDQVKNGMCLGLMCTDMSSIAKLPSLNQMYDVISGAYESCVAMASRYQNRSHGDGFKRHKRVQSS